MGKHNKSERYTKYQRQLRSSVYIFNIIIENEGHKFKRKQCEVNWRKKMKGGMMQLYYDLKNKRYFFKNCKTMLIIQDHIDRICFLNTQGIIFHNTVIPSKL